LVEPLANPHGTAQERLPHGSVAFIARESLQLARNSLQQVSQLQHLAVQIAGQFGICGHPSRLNDGCDRSGLEPASVG
jgi:hypothetical protein